LHPRNRFTASLSIHSYPLPENISSVLTDTEENT
jgi:hypothetical protein